jgi:glycine cleavage system H lipoate-binding protein
MVAIFVVLTIIFFLTVDLIYQRIMERRAAAASTQKIFKFDKSVPISTISVPDGLFFHPGHSWAAVTADGKVRVGIDDFTNKFLGRLDRIEVKNPGRRVKQGEPLLVLHQGNRTAEVVSPVDGFVEMTNTGATSNPDTVRFDPYNAGWVCALKPINLMENLKNLNIADAAKAWAREELERMRDFLTGASFENKLVGQTLQDGGAPVEGVLSHMSDEAWVKFRDEFLTS